NDSRLVRSVAMCATILAALTGLAGLTGLATASPLAEQRPIDTGRSTLTVFVYKSGLFAAFADNHTIKAPIASGSLVEGDTPSVELSVRAADLTVVDRELSPDKRAEVQARMVGAEVLDVTTFPTITFTSTSIAPAGPDRWRVSGRLALHGRT